MDTHHRADNHRRTLHKRAGLTRAERLFLWLIVGSIMLVLVIFGFDPTNALQEALLHCWSALLAFLGPHMLWLIGLVLVMMVLITIIGAIQSFFVKRKIPRVAGKQKRLRYHAIHQKHG